MLTDIEISRSAQLRPIFEIAHSLGIEDHIPYGKHKAKIYPQDRVNPDSKLILVTAITPNKAGVGKTVTSVSLSLGLNHIGRKSIVVLREPSLGPCFGMKGGAAGGGYAQVLPMQDINLHFTGDFHAITSANNMIAALLDNHRYYYKTALSSVLWKRVLDVNDRMLRQTITGLGQGLPTETGFDITAASEIMALLCLAKDEQDLMERLDRIVLGYTHQKTPFTLADLGVSGSIAVLLKDALLPNLVQTTEHTPALIHGGPFANIAHGCNSLIATRSALALSEFVVTEAGFGSDLGAEKFLDIKCRVGDLRPSAAVLVASLQAIKLHGGATETSMQHPDSQALKKGWANVRRHVDNLKGFNQNIILSLNRYGFDTETEINQVLEWCADLGIEAAVNEGFAKGGAGAASLAEKVAKLAESRPAPAIHFAYENHQPITEKLQGIVSRVYGGRGVKLSAQAQSKLSHFEKFGWDKLPVCVAKTQYSFSHDTALGPHPQDFDFQVQDFVVNAGAGFVVAIAGDIMRMPGLPKSPQALKIKMTNGEIDGLS